jgi:hypothetical protein
VVSNNRPRIASDVSEDPLHLRNELIPDTRSEASVPISLGSLVLGVLDVHSDRPGAFSKDTIIMLQTLASQIATAIQTTGLIETSQVNFEELERLYRSSRLIADASNEEQVWAISGQILKDVPYPTVLLQVDRNQLRVISSADATQGLNSIDQLPSKFEAEYGEVNNYLLRGPIITSPSESSTPSAFSDLIKRLEITSAAFIPIKKQDNLSAVILIGARDRVLTNTTIQLYSNLGIIKTQIIGWLKLDRFHFYGL